MNSIKKFKIKVITEPHRCEECFIWLAEVSYTKKILIYYTTSIRLNKTM